MPLMVSISGIRGIVGDGLTPEIVVQYASAFGEYCRRKSPVAPSVVLGRDGRITGKAIANIVSSTLIAQGVNVRAIGICPTPTVQIAVEKSGAAGGIAVTASHNPAEWNGLKFMAGTGMFLDADENRQLWSIAADHRSYASWNALGAHLADDSWIRKHVDAVLSLPYIRREAISRRRFKVVLDCVNAAGGVIVPQMLRELGCEVVEMNCDVSGIFSHMPEPIPENLSGLAARVRAERADIGIAVDPDVDRLVLITEGGEPYGEEYTVSSAVKFILTKERPATRRAKVVVNLSTTRAVEDITEEFGAELIRTPVGEIHVAKKMKQVGALVGGEGSGGVILPAVHYGRDAIVGIGLILQMLAESGGTLSALKAGLPQYAIAKGKVELGKHSPDLILQTLQASLAGEGRVNVEDGVRIDYPEYWIHFRKSNTEPIIRIIAEARTLQQASAVMEDFKKRVIAFAT
jgi:phosphomannomutase